MFQPSVEKIKFTKEDDLTDFYYEDGVMFEKPLVVRGTRKQFVPYPAINKMQEATEENVTTILNTLQPSEDMASVYLGSISDINLITIAEQGFFIKVTEETVDRTEERNLFIPFDESSVAFRRFSNILKIPYAFSKKNPGHLNDVNFIEWKDRICKEKNTDIPVCVVYSKTNIVEVEHENVSYPCNLVMTLLPVGTVKKADGSKSLIKKEIADQIPVLHKVVPSVIEGLKKEIPGVKIVIHSIATGFKGENKGDHFIKFLVDSPELKWNVNGDDYMPTISLRSNFTGDDKKTLGNAFISLSLMKLTCANGAMVAIPEQHLQTIRDNFVSKLLEMNKIEPNNPHYQRYLLKYSKQFKKKFADFGCNIPLHELIHNFSNTDFVSLLKIFLSCKETLIQEAFQDLQTPFGNVRDEDFVEVIETLSKKNKFKPDMSKAVILEYLAAKKEGVVTFPNSYSIVSYLTYMAQAYNSKMQSEVERKVISFGRDITAALVHKAQFRQETLARYQEMLKN